jgi:hypothetical protein
VVSGGRSHQSIFSELGHKVLHPQRIHLAVGDLDGLIAVGPFDVDLVAEKRNGAGIFRIEFRVGRLFLRRALLGFFFGLFSRDLRLGGLILAGSVELNTIGSQKMKSLVLSHVRNGHFKSWWGRYLA